MNNKQRAQRLAEQIQKRFEILAEWSEVGVPDGYLVPPSLTKIRTWNDAELHLAPIKSASSFTKTHPAHGELVRKIDVLRKALVAPRNLKRKPKTSAAKLLRSEREKSESLTIAMTNAANQYVSLKAQFDDIRRRLRVEEQARDDAEQIIDQQQQTIHELKSELARLRNNSGESNITSIKFGID